MKCEQDFVNFLQKLESYSGNILKGIGDDCSIVKFNNKKKYVFTTDTSLLGPHFTKDYSPEDIGYKCLATNISDIASMGCMPLYAMYALTLPKMSESWLKRFYKGSQKLLKQHKVSIIGGDTTRGPLSITIQMIGIQKHNILLRSGAKLGDDIYVTGTIGNARAALLSKKRTLAYNYFKKYLVNPTPRVDLGLEISKFASSCIDISDGLAKDLKNIALSSDKGFIVNVDKIPLRPKFSHFIPEKLLEECILGGGEDYELCFTANNKYYNNINTISNKIKLKITKIGSITSKGYKYIKDGKAYKVKTKGYDHFSNR
jgi:thiamine-monophosphate kinase